jgi:hypothetical protein
MLRINLVFLTVQALACLPISSQVIAPKIVKGRLDLVLQFQSELLNTLYIELEETQGRMQGLDRTETKASVTSSTKVPDDTIPADDLRNNDRVADFRWWNNEGIIYNDDPDIYERSPGTSRERTRKQVTDGIYIRLNKIAALAYIE